MPLEPLDRVLVLPEPLLLVKSVLPEPLDLAMPLEPPAMEQVNLEKLLLVRKKSSSRPSRLNTEKARYRAKVIKNWREPKLHAGLAAKGDGNGIESCISLDVFKRSVKIKKEVHRPEMQEAEEDKLYGAFLRRQAHVFQDQETIDKARQ
jgi:hypothetical protein